MKAKMKYDFETDILKIMPVTREYDSSFQEKNLIFDMDSEGRVVGFEMLDASEILGIPKCF